MMNDNGDCHSPTGATPRPSTLLRVARMRRQMTLQEVAAAVGSNTGNLSRIERGLQVPSQSLAERLANFFNNEVSATQIMVGSVAPATDNC